MVYSSVGVGSDGIALLLDRSTIRFQHRRAPKMLLPTSYAISVGFSFDLIRFDKHVMSVDQDDKMVLSQDAVHSIATDVLPIHSSAFHNDCTRIKCLLLHTFI